MGDATAGERGARSPGLGSGAALARGRPGQSPAWPGSQSFEGPARSLSSLVSASSPRRTEVGRGFWGACWEGPTWWGLGWDVPAESFFLPSGLF